MSLSHTQLRRWYRQFNARWFEGRLPEDMDVFYAPDDENHGFCEAHPNGVKIIRIDTKLAGTRHAQIDLIHEMNHHDTGAFNHGARFEAGMQRLARIGAFKGIW